MIHPLTKKLKQQIKDYIFELTVELPKQLEYALSLGDLSENAEYEMAKERQLFVESRIVQLEKLLNRLKAINLDELPNDRVAYGSRVTVEDLDSEQEKTFLIVFDGEDPPHKTNDDILVTIESPIARALFGKKAGDDIQVNLPKGSFDWEITKLVTFPELTKQV
jgi:transcription elongation factor GreA